MNVSDIKRYVGKRKCPNECAEKDKEHKGQFIIHYHIPSVGVVSAMGDTEDDADKIARQEAVAAIAKIYAQKLKEIQDFEKLLEFK